MTRQELIDDFQHFLDTHKKEVEAHLSEPQLEWFEDDGWDDIVEKGEKTISVMKENQMTKYYVSFIFANGYGSTTVEIGDGRLTESSMKEMHRLLSEKYKEPMILSLIKLDDEESTS